MTYPAYMNNTKTWMAHSVMQVQQENINTGRFPNGQKMTQRDIVKAEEEVKACRQVLIDAGIINNQLTLF